MYIKVQPDRRYVKMEKRGGKPNLTQSSEAITGQKQNRE